MKDIRLSYTTAAGGGATVLGETAIAGKLYAVEYHPGTTDTGATLALTCEGIASKPLLTKASAGTTNSWYYPRDLMHKVEDGTALTGTAGADRTMPILAGVPKLVVASGGNAMSGAVVLHYCD